MVSAEEIGGVAVFAALTTEERERLSRAAADIGLAPGEYAAHEEDERAIFAVLEGRIEATKTVDGVEALAAEPPPPRAIASGTAGTRPARGCAASSTATRSASGGWRAQASVSSARRPLHHPPSRCRPFPTAHAKGEASERREQ